MDPYGEAAIVKSHRPLQLIAGYVGVIAEAAREVGLSGYASSRLTFAPPSPPLNDEMTETAALADS